MRIFEYRNFYFLYSFDSSQLLGASLEIVNTTGLTPRKSPRRMPTENHDSLVLQLQSENRAMCSRIEFLEYNLQTLWNEVAVNSCLIFICKSYQMALWVGNFVGSQTVRRRKLQKEGKVYGGFVLYYLVYNLLISRNWIRI